MPNLFTKLDLGPYSLPSRVVMAPMTRSRADDDGHVGPLTATYYAQRASAALIITEGVFPSAMGKGYVRTPGLVTAEHVAAWRAVTDAVHARGGRIFAQIMHAGRISDPSFLPGGATPVAPSAVRPSGASYTDAGMKPHVTPRALETSEIAGVIDEHARATRNALDAGFDGVELHAASGYLVSQFLHSGTNARTDRYGGSVANRARFALETLEAMRGVAGADRVGIKVSPELAFNDVSDDDPIETYTHLARALAPLGLAYLHVSTTPASAHYHARMRPLFGGTYLAGGGFERASADAMLASGGADAIVFGSLFVSNPDLPARLARGLALTPPDPSTFYTPGPKGYIDYESASNDEVRVSL